MNLSDCESIELLTIIYYIKVFLRILLFLVPVVLIIMGSIDIFKAVSSSADDMKKIISTSVKRIIASLLTLLVPTIVGVIVSWFGDYASGGIL